MFCLYHSHGVYHFYFVFKHFPRDKITHIMYWKQTINNFKYMYFFSKSKNNSMTNLQILGYFHHLFLMYGDSLTVKWRHRLFEHLMYYLYHKLNAHIICRIHKYCSNNNIFFPIKNYFLVLCSRWCERQGQISDICQD